MKNFIQQIITMHKNFYILAVFSHLDNNWTNNKNLNVKYGITYCNQIIPRSSLRRQSVTKLHQYGTEYMKIIIVSDYTGLAKPYLVDTIRDYNGNFNRIDVVKYTYPLFFNEINLINLFSENNKTLDNTYFLFSRTA